MLDRSDLHDYQTDQAIPHILDHDRCAVWMDVGGGKSVTTLTALDDLAAVETNVWPALVLGTKRIARSVWGPEAGEWSHLQHLKSSTILGSADERRAGLRKKADFYTINRENIGWLVDLLGDDWPFKTVVWDEVSAAKGFRLRQGSKNAGKLGKIAHTKIERLIGLTATPASNGLKDLWGPTWFYDEGQRLGRTYSAFENRWFRKGWDGFSMEPMPHAEKEIQDKLRDICLTVDVPAVDEPIKNDIYVDLPPAARRIYDEMERKMYAEIEEIGVEAFSAASRSSACEQIANGAVYYNDDHDWKLVHDAKIEAMASIIEESSGSPVLATYQFKHDLACLQRAFPKGVVLDDKTSTIDRWNDGGIGLLFVHPQCLHPSTEVLTEFRGWVRIIEVERDERVFDGEEFVSHKGCHFSGVKSVIERFGLTLTPAHKLLINDVWVEAQNVRDCEDSRRAARYTYCGSETRLREMCSVRRRSDDASTKRREGQQRSSAALSFMFEGHFPLHDRHSILPHLAGNGVESHRPWMFGLRSLWRGWERSVRRLAKLQQFPSRHDRWVPGRFDDRTGRQREGLLQGELSLGNEYGATSEQEQQSRAPLPRSRHAPSRVLSRHRDRKGCDATALEPGDECRGSGRRLREINIQKEPKTSDVYDLVDCGPRNRFLVRNAAGEMFVSHNSAGHGLNLARGGHILARFGFSWDLEHYDQVIGRIGPRRQKQAGLNRPVFDHRILARNTVDELKRDRIASKRSVQDILKDALRRRK